MGPLPGSQPLRWQRTAGEEEALPGERSRHSGARLSEASGSGQGSSSPADTSTFT